ncbi:nuclease harbi1 [Plakobranchus ocellatus]|uniref:Nuclease harbi1 n=1 Tax=Plakobranchus ocellatus TaxID=259542 RepID=A0AAV4BJ06_9GAST|nr:nuclease harbi1 [Plakobranchus ocellatus]
MGASTIRSIIYTTCHAIWEGLSESELPQLTEQDFKAVADGLKKTWNYPHVLGAIDGKHIKIECPPRSGSTYHNYKQTFSIVLQAVCDSESNFIAIDVGDYGRHSDGGIFNNSSFGRALLSNNLPIPPAEDLCGQEVLHFVFLGDEAYPLMRNLLRPFPQRKILGLLCSF